MEEKQEHISSIDGPENKKSFSWQVDESLKGTLSPYTAIKICDTPKLLLDVGCSQFPMLYTQRHLRNAVKPMDRKEHQHGLTVEQIKKLPQLLEMPVMIFDSISKSDSLIVVTSEFDSKDNPILVSVKPNGKGRYEVEEINSNFVTSVYGRNNFADFFKRTVDKDCVLYANKEKSQGMFERWGEQYSELANTLDFDIIIHQSRNIVNGNFTKTLGRTASKSDQKEQKRVSVLDKLNTAKRVIEQSANESERKERSHSGRDERNR
ncbi:MAG: hypothetical protein HDR21_13325 [Lachnospiraceae bacterium]|nr:hypothetical protein [Lachnospiraceae bacterium]MDE5818313.1 hypothetical protein [Lachnospiraceae bacterium]MDE7239126.1 hypothetical protein [Lachnospiraceae bacterium]